ncbi:hypothetical protein MAR_021722, partial [Mya arenaria]
SVATNYRTQDLCQGNHARYIRKQETLNHAALIKMLTFSLFVIWMCFLYSVYGAVTISPKTEFPMNGESFTFTCENHISGNNINWAAGTGGSSSSLTSCDASTDNTCFPTAPGFTFSSDVSIHEFYMHIDSISLSNCKTYAYVNIDVPSLTVSEPAEKTDGQVSIETDCLTPVSAEGVEYETCESETQTSSPTGCTDTCNGETWAKVTVQYQYTQATHNPVEGNLRVRIKHTGDSNNPREIV